VCNIWGVFLVWGVLLFKISQKSTLLSFCLRLFIDVSLWDFLDGRRVYCIWGVFLIWGVLFQISQKSACYSPNYTQHITIETFDFFFFWRCLFCRVSQRLFLYQNSSHFRSIVICYRKSSGELTSECFPLFFSDSPCFFWRVAWRLFLCQDSSHVRSIFILYWKSNDELTSEFCFFFP